jgi:flagellar motor switch protein FliN/FliY
MTAAVNHRPVDLFCGSVLSALGDVLSQVSGQPWKVESAPAEAGEAEVEIEFECRGTVRGPFAFRMPVAVAVRLAKLLTGEPMPEDIGQLGGDDREALEELLRQVAGIAATRLEAEFGKLQLAFVGASPAAQGGERFPLSAVAESQRLSIDICVGNDLGQSLDLATSESKGAEVKVPEAVLPSSAAAGALTKAAIREGNLELLWDVALSLTLRFGQRELLLKEILELSPGAVLELDRQIDEPVDLLLGRKVIARGEVVIVDGNYGLRVTEVASAAEKLACLP